MAIIQNNGSNKDSKTAVLASKTTKRIKQVTAIRESKRRIIYLKLIENRMFYLFNKLNSL